jgi:carboxyl-terminal processing protease
LVKRRFWPWLTGAAFLLGVCCLGTPLFAAPAPELDALRARAQKYEQAKQWRNACIIYETILSKDGNANDHKRYQFCLQRVQQARRHRQKAFKDAVIGLKPSEALKAYVRVLEILQSHYVDHEKTDTAALFRQGLLELRYALEDRAFVKDYLEDAKPEAVAAFRGRLESWSHESVATKEEARKQVFEVVRDAHQSLKLPCPIVVFEFICGACNCFDEYTSYVTPGELKSAQATRGRLARVTPGVGIEVGIKDGEFVITQIHPDAPAAKTLQVGDRLTKIDGKRINAKTAAEVRAQLHGKAGSKVKLETERPAEQMMMGSTRSITELERQPYVMPTVDKVGLLKEDPEIGHIRVRSFNENTVQELKDAILDLQAAGMKKLILDLRGNPGGRFESSLQIAEMFLTKGLIVHTQSHLPDFNKAHESHNPDALTLPLAILIDGETASSAEVLAGALKENQRAVLVGQTSYGKGTIQIVVPLDNVSAGVRVTVAKFLSPTGHVYNGKGITPDILEKDDPLQAAVRELRGMMMPMMER